jgi:hypothetical protein
MEEGVQQTVLGLPEDFDLTADQAQALQIDQVVSGASLDLGIFDTSTRLVHARNAAVEREERPAADALHLLVIISGMGLSDNKRAPFLYHTAGHFADGSLWREPLPEDLTDRHVAVLETLLGVVSTPVLRARIADVLWHRIRRRNPLHAREAIKAYLEVAEATFAPEGWTESEQHFGRAYRLASQLGRESPEFATVVAKAWVFLDRLRGNDPLFYTERLVSRIMGTLSNAEAKTLYERVKGIAEESAVRHDFHRARVYYESAISLAGQLGQSEDQKSLRLTHAETHVLEAMDAPSETQRAMHLRDARDALLDAGAPRERRDEIGRLLEESQRAMVSEMTTISVLYSSGALPEHVQNLLRGKAPIQALWLLAGLPVMMTHEGIRKAAEEGLSKFHFHFGFGRRHISADGREQGQTPGSLGADEAEREEALIGAMHDYAKESRMHTVLGAVEPGRRQLALQHEYTISEIYEALETRPFIPRGHLLLWAKGVHAGIVGDYDVAVHIIAPQLEHALREVLRRHGETVYTTRAGVQSFWYLPAILEHPLSKTIFTDDIVFALDAALSDRIGANVRNEVAHGIINDASSNGYDAAFVWWLALRVLRFYGKDALELSAVNADNDAGAAND